MYDSYKSLGSLLSTPPRPPPPTPRADSPLPAEERHLEGLAAELPLSLGRNLAGGDTHLALERSAHLALEMTAHLQLHL